MLHGGFEFFPVEWSLSFGVIEVAEEQGKDPFGVGLALREVEQVVIEGREECAFEFVEGGDLAIVHPHQPAEAPRVAVGF